MKVVHRSGAGSYFEPVSLKRSGDKGLALAHRVRK